MAEQQTRQQPLRQSALNYLLSLERNWRQLTVEEYGIVQGNKGVGSWGVLKDVLGELLTNCKADMVKSERLKKRLADALVETGAFEKYEKGREDVKKKITDYMSGVSEDTKTCIDRVAHITFRESLLALYKELYEIGREYDFFDARTISTTRFTINTEIKQLEHDIFFQKALLD